jgi:drug/metabolite transporter (DMT)-like permease
MFSRTTAALAVATVLFSLVGVFVKLIHLPSAGIALGRAVVALIALLGFLMVRRRPLFALRKPADLLPLCLLGVLMAGNWFFYFAAIKASTVAVAVISLFTYPLITALIEPVLLRQRYRIVDCVGAVVIVAGVMLVVPRFSITDSTALGALFGVISALSLALCNVVNKKLVVRYSSIEMMAYQFMVAAILFLPAFPALMKPMPVVEVVYLALLGAVLTTFSLFLFINSFKYLAASTAGILTSLQPFITVGFAYLLLNEIPTIRTILGGLIICSTVVLVGAQARKDGLPSALPE